MNNYSKKIKGYAIRMKQNPTKAESDFNIRLKKVLKNKYPYLKNENQKAFRHPFGWYILDFYIGGVKLGFEVDGGYHWNTKQLDKDLKRDYFFDSQSIFLVHLPNSQLDNQKKRKYIELFIEKTIEKRIGMLRNISPIKYKKLKESAISFYIIQLITILKTRLISCLNLK